MCPWGWRGRLLRYFLAMEELPASVVSLVYFFKPALAPVLAWQLHGEAIPANMMAGILLIVAGSLCAIIPRAAGGAPETAGRRAGRRLP